MRFRRMDFLLRRKLAGSYCRRCVRALNPAKYARALIRRIYEHLRCAKRIAPGDTCLDPFGGVGLGALDAMFHGLNWIGVELESRFHQLGLENICLWNERYKGWPGWGTARLLNGDSRQLCSVVKEANCIVSSPPFCDANYMPEPNWDDEKIAAYVEEFNRRHGKGRLSVETIKRRQEQYRLNSKTSPGNLHHMPPGDVAAVISSPPYEGSTGNPRIGGYEINKTAGGGDIASRGRNGNTSFYGQTEGQIGHTIGETFWEASATIVSQCYQILRPGGVACWVVKAFVRKGKIVDFPGQWLALCQSVGFRHLHTHHAMLVTDAGHQGMLFGEPEALRKEKKSFFRRLAEKKGSPAIDFETVLCLEK